MKKTAQMNRTKAPKMMGSDLNLYLKNMNTINANVVPMILVRNTHNTQGRAKRRQNHRFFRFSSVR